MVIDTEISTRNKVYKYYLRDKNDGYLLYSSPKHKHMKSGLFT